MLVKSVNPLFIKTYKHIIHCPIIITIKGSHLYTKDGYKVTERFLYYWQSLWFNRIITSH